MRKRPDGERAGWRSVADQRTGSGDPDEESGGTNGWAAATGWTRAGQAHGSAGRTMAQIRPEHDEIEPDGGFPTCGRWPARSGTQEELDTDESIQIKAGISIGRGDR